MRRARFIAVIGMVHIGAIALFPNEQAQAQSCDGLSTIHTILNNRTWEGLGCDDDTARFVEGSERWGEYVKREYHTAQSDNPSVTLDYLKNETDGDRVLILITHGTEYYPTGEPGLDVFLTIGARDDAYDQYRSAGFQANEIEKHSDPPSIILRATGIRNHFRT